MKFFPPQATNSIRITSVLQRGELVYDTDNNRLYYGDGSTLGGLEVGTMPVTETPSITFVLQENTPSEVPPPNSVILYMKTDEQLYYKKNDGSENLLNATP